MHDSLFRTVLSVMQRAFAAIVVSARSAMNFNTRCFRIVFILLPLYAQ